MNFVPSQRFLIADYVIYCRCFFLSSRDVVLAHSGSRPFYTGCLIFSVTVYLKLKIFCVHKATRFFTHSELQSEREQ